MSDPSQFQSSNQVEIGSSGRPDDNEYSWNLGSSLSAGWNFIQLNTKVAGKIGNPDLSAINWFRLYRKKNGSVTTRIDAIQLLGENGLSLNDFNQKEDFGIYPNPVESDLYFDFSLTKSTKISITIVNLFGQVVSKSLNNHVLNPGSHNLKIPLGHLKTGAYIAKINIDGMASTKKIVIK